MQSFHLFILLVSLVSFTKYTHTHTHSLTHTLLLCTAKKIHIWSHHLFLYTHTHIIWMQIWFSFRSHFFLINFQFLLSHQNSLNITTASRQMSDIMYSVSWFSFSCSCSCSCSPCLSCLLFLVSRENETHLNIYDKFMQIDFHVKNSLKQLFCMERKIPW